MPHLYWVRNEASWKAGLVIGYLVLSLASTIGKSDGLMNRKDVKKTTKVSLKNSVQEALEQKKITPASKIVAKAIRSPKLEVQFCFLSLFLLSQEDRISPPRLPSNKTYIVPWFEPFQGVLREGVGQFGEY